MTLPILTPYMSLPSVKRRRPHAHDSQRSRGRTGMRRIAGPLHCWSSAASRFEAAALVKRCIAFFEAAASGKGTGDLLFPRADGTPWPHTRQFRPMRAACKA